MQSRSSTPTSIQGAAGLRFLGATRGPSRNTGTRQEPWFIEYRRQAENDYLEKVKERGGAEP